MAISTVAVIVFFTCLGMGAYIGYSCAGPLYFDVKFSLPLIRRYQERRKLRDGWNQGRLEHRVKRACAIRGVIIGLMGIFVAYFCLWAGNLLTAVAGFICYTAGVGVFVLAQLGKDDLYSQQTALKFREKYEKYVI